ncbi:InlB B-repeat-containing protein [Dietzia sp. B32]|uniref:InlB B-repeat-containing protein n=1 Tax=Dietzia sp. B32 TaxID=2915130 RepID=UPI0021ADF580|nr:InlB B-repeat-containing protein [Dietzia sp. B32]UVE96452.1 InlB B-repeat-containing protein [Dietzia sp. B32]
MKPHPRRESASRAAELGRVPDVVVVITPPPKRPAAPERTGYTFTGWYTSPDGGEPLDPETPLTEDLTVHAGWRPDSVPATPVTPASGSLSGGSLEMLIAVARQG